MREIEVGELRARLDSVLRDVSKGQQVRVVRRGRPVAEIVPLETGDEQWRRMVGEGKITPASRPPSEAPPPAPRQTGRSASAIVLAERAEED